MKKKPMKLSAVLKKVERLDSRITMLYRHNITIGLSRKGLAKLKKLQEREYKLIGIAGGEMLTGAGLLKMYSKVSRYENDLE